MEYICYITIGFGFVGLLIATILITSYSDKLISPLFAFLGVFAIATGSWQLIKEFDLNTEFKDIASEYQQIIKNDSPTPDDLNKIKEKIKLKYDYEVQIIDNNCLSNVYREKETDIKTKNEKETIKQIDTLNNKGNDKFIKVSLYKDGIDYIITIYESSFKTYKDINNRGRNY